MPNVFLPKITGRASAVQLHPQPTITAVSVTDNRPTAVRQRQIQEAANQTNQRIIQVKPLAVQVPLTSVHQGHAVVQRVILKGKTPRSGGIGLKASDFYKNLPSDQHRNWAVVLHADESKHYTKQEALKEINDRLAKGELPPAVTGQEDPQMRILIERYQTGNSRKQDRQVAGMHGLYEKGSKAEKDQMVGYLGGPANAKGFTDSVRQGELNETLLTSDTKEAALRSLGAVSGVKTKAIIDKSGDNYYWTDYQKDTSYPTRSFIFPNTTTDANGYEFQDTHINGDTYREDSKGVKHLTVGSTSDKYHFSPKASLKTNLARSTRLVSFARRNAKFHKKMLATREQILATPASDRGEQMYRTTNGTILNLNVAGDLEIFAEHTQIHTDKVNTALHRHARRLRAKGDESESDVSDYENEVEPDVDSDDEAETRIKKRKLTQALTNAKMHKKTKKQKTS